jgi:hypothetical protein
MTPAELRAARDRLRPTAAELAARALTHWRRHVPGLSARELAARLARNPTTGRAIGHNTIFVWESAARQAPVPPGVAAQVRAMLDAQDGASAGAVADQPPELRSR